MISMNIQVHLHSYTQTRNVHTRMCTHTHTCYTRFFIITTCIHWLADYFCFINIVNVYFFICYFVIYCCNLAKSTSRGKIKTDLLSTSSVPTSLLQILTPFGSLSSFQFQFRNVPKQFICKTNSKC